MAKSEFEFIHDGLYGETMKVMKSFTGAHRSRPILNYVLHKDNGDVIATDSMTLLEVKNVHGFKEEVLIDPTTFMMAKGKYADLTNIGKQQGHKEAFKLNKEQIKLWTQLFKSINQTLKIMKDPRGAAEFKFTHGGVELNLEKLKVKMNMPVQWCAATDSLESITFNAALMKKALEAHHKLGSEEITVYLYGKMRPIVTDDHVRVSTLVLPIRSY